METSLGTSEYGGEFGDLVIASKGEVTCALPGAEVGHASLFPGLSQFCKLISIKSGCCSHEDREYIARKTQEWLTNDITEECQYPWRA